MSCRAKRELERGHSGHYCYKCTHEETSVQDLPCRLCFGLTTQCAWTPKEAGSMEKNNAALLYVLAEIKCELCTSADEQRERDKPCDDCDFADFREHYKKLAE